MKTTRTNGLRLTVAGIVLIVGCDRSVIELPCEGPRDCSGGAVCVDGVCSATGDGGLTTVVLGEGLGADVTDVTTDTFIERADPGKNWGVEPLLHTDNGTSQTRVGLIRFGLDTLPAGAVVESAVLGLTTWQNNPSDDVHFVHEILEAWEEGTGSDDPGIANWTERTGTATWSVAGCGSPSSRSSVVLAQFTPDAATDPQRFALPISAALIQQWLGTPSSNHGVAIVVGGDDGGSLISSEGVSDLRPYLEVTYR